MSDTINYLLHANGVFILLYLVYVLFLRRLTFHKVNRFYLVALIPLSLIIPFVNIELASSVPVAYTEFDAVFEDFGGFEPIALQHGEAVSQNMGIETIIALLYSVVALFFILRLIMSAFKLIRLKQRSETYEENGFSINIANVPTVFSCFKWIFVPERNSDLQNPVIDHEKLHGKALHTVDLIITEIFIALFWLNPFVYLFRRDLKSVHEYQIDNSLLQKDVKKSHYLQLMLDNLESTYQIAGFCNSFNGSTVKKRVKMITKNKSSIWKIAGYLFILPVLAIMTLSFTPITLNTFSTSEVVSAYETSSTDYIPSISPIRTGEYERISSEYGMRTHPITKEYRMHTGMDIVAKTGTEIIATANGTVTRVHFYEGGYGKTVMVNHGNGYETRYTQMSNYAVKEGDKVKRGNVVGYVGSSGISTGPHLHYEVLKNGEKVNPRGYIKELE